MNVFILIFILILTVSCVYSEGEVFSLKDECEIVEKLGYNVDVNNCCDGNIQCDYGDDDKIHITKM